MRWLHAPRCPIPRIGTVTVLATLLWQLPFAVSAGEGFLNRNLKASDAVPYGRDLEAPRASGQTPAGEGATPTAAPVPEPTPFETSPVGE